MMRVTGLAILGILGSLAAWGASVEFAVDGKPTAAIVVEQDADDLVKAAADDLRHYIGLISGVTLPVQHDGKAVPGAAVYVGDCETSRKEDLPPEGSNPETYAVRVRDGNVYLTGRHAPAKAFAVVSLIEDELGVRWFAPGALWESVPEGTPGELRVDVRERLVPPDWSARVWSGHAWTSSWRQWNLRNKTIYAPPAPFRNMQNHLHTVFAPEKYAESHPEYYPLIDGKRWIPPEGYRNWRPCVSNPDVVRLTVEAAREYLDAHPEHNAFSLAMDDIYKLCGCDKCRALDAKPDDYENKRFSDRHYKFVNAVARELAKTHPDKFIGTLCYHIARELPETVDKLEPNVFISMTQRVGEWWRPGRREDDIQLTHAWRKRCQHMSRYGYMGLGFLTPRVFPHAMAEGMKLDHSLGFLAVYNECYVILPNAAPMMWMMAKLQWDTERDADALLDEFYEAMFGPAAQAMKRYYEVLEESYMEARPDRVATATWGHRSLRTQAMAMSVVDVERAQALLAEAESTADDAKIRARIDVVGAALRYGAYVIRAGEIARGMAESEEMDASQARDAMDSLLELMRLDSEREQFWADALERDDILGESLRGLQGRGYFVTNQMPSVLAPAASAMGLALDALADESPDEAAAAVARLAQEGQGILADKAQAWLLATQGNLKNILSNPGFEEMGKNTGEPEADWDASQAPPGWLTWSGGPGSVSFPLVEGKGRENSRAAGISGAASACYLQSVDVKPGERYLCVVHARQREDDVTGGAKLTVRWRTAGDAWHPRRDLESEITLTVSGKRWHRLGTVVTVPEGAAKLVLLLSAKDQKGNHAVLYDDAAVYPLPKE